jgi:diguanylate cyclase (GGDEF)-like protein
VIYAVVFIVMIKLHPGTEFQYKYFHNVYQILPPLFAGICGVVYARRAHQDTTSSRIGWLLIGLGALSFAAGQATWTWYESVLMLETLPSPGLADIGYVGSYPLLIAGVVLLFGSINPVGRARLLVDSALAAGSVALLSWYFVVSRIWGNNEVTPIGKIISVAYPLGDVLVFFCAMVLLSSPTTSLSLRRSLGFLATGIVLIAFADTLYTYDNLKGTYHTGSWFDWGWSFGWLLIGYASLLPMWWPREEETSAAPVVQSQVPGLLRVLAPYLAVTASFWVVVSNDLSVNGRVDLQILLAGSALIALVILRQVLTILENQNLTSQLRSFNLNLEKVVVQRTEQVAAILHLTKAVNNTRHEEEVLAAALEHTYRALQADAIMIRILDPDSLNLAEFRHTGLENHPRIIEFIKQLPPLNRVQSMTLPLPENESDDAVAHFVRAPLFWQQKVIGSIGAIRWNMGFNETDTEMLESIGFEVGTAYENARRYSEAVEAADRDSVTGLFNHRAVHQRLDEEVRAAAISGNPLTVIMMDLNNFKLFNDTYGHPVGDQVLKRVARILETECRGSDIIGRYGGDEFIVVLPETDAATALHVAQRLRDGTNREGFRRQGDQHAIPVTLSFGIATYPTDSDNRHELLAIADSNLYSAKGSEEGIRGTTDDQRANRQLRTEGTFEVLDAMVTAIDNKDQYTRRHSEDVTSYALLLAEEMALSEETLRIVRIGCLLHDVGKIGVPDDILRKPGRLTAEEFEVLKRHPRLGELIVGALPGMENILDIVRSHHERWDGQGYPEALAGEAIPLLGRLVALADAFSAMTTNRPYRIGLNWREALQEIRANVGTQFDPTLAKSFIAVIERHYGREQLLGINAQNLDAGAPGKSTLEGNSSTESNGHGSTLDHKERVGS